MVVCLFALFGKVEHFSDAWREVMVALYLALGDGDSILRSLRSYECRAVGSRTGREPDCRLLFRICPCVPFSIMRACST